MYLVDKSALARLVAVPAVAARLGTLIVDELVATCGMVDLEVLYSARSNADYEEMREVLRGLPRVAINDDHFNQALAIQRRLAEVGKHRVPLPDLIIASVALLSDRAVLHYDRDFDTIAEVSEVRHEWVAPKGSLP